MSEEVIIEDPEGKIVEQLDECGDLLMLCEVEDRHCEDCGRSSKRDCLLFIKSVLSSLCRLEVARNGGLKKDIEESLYI